MPTIPVGTEIQLLQGLCAKLGISPESYLAGTEVQLLQLMNAGIEYLIEQGGGGGGAVSSVFGRTGAILPVSGDYTIDQIGGIGTGVATALGVNIDSAGALIVNAGALGTPSSGVLTNCTGLPAANVLAGSLGAGNFSIAGASGAAALSVEGGGATLALNVTKSGVPIFSIDASTGLATFTPATTIYAVAVADNRVALNAFGMGLGSDGYLVFCSGNAISGTQDTGLTRGGVGIIKATAGFSGYGTVDAGDYQVSGVPGVTAGPFTLISSIQVVGGIVTVLTGT